MSWVIAWRGHLVRAEPIGVAYSVEAALKFRTWKAAKAWAVGVWGDEIFANTSRVFVISVEQLAALRDWRARHGTRWRFWLKKEWDRGDCRFELRQLRNMFSPEWLHKQRLVR